MRQFLNLPLGWPPHTSLLRMPMGGLGALGEVPARSSSALLGNARLMRDDEICQKGRVYTYRTWSSVAIDPEREVVLNIDRSFWDRYGSWAAMAIVPVSLPVTVPARLIYEAGRGGDSAWEAAEQMGWRVSAPRGHASFWQNRTRQSQGYATSLNITPTADGVRAAAVKWAARRILSFMAGSSSPEDVTRIQAGWLYERDRTEEGASVLRRAAEAVIGRDNTRVAVELGSEIATEAETAILGSVAEREAEERRSRERLTYGAVGAGILFVLGIFLATRPGSSKVERTAASGVRAARESTSDAFTPTIRVTNRRRRRNTRGGKTPAPGMTVYVKVKGHWRKVLSVAADERVDYFTVLHLALDKIRRRMPDWSHKPLKIVTPRGTTVYGASEYKYLISGMPTGRL